MNKNYVITFLIIVALLVGAYFLFRDGGVWNLKNRDVATTTPESVSTNYATPNNTANTAGVPLVETGNTAVPSNTTVVLTGSVTPNGAPTTYWFEYGGTNSLGSKTTVQSLGSGFVKISTPAYITGLSANKTYYYRLVAANKLGTVTGETFSFTTNNNPAPSGSLPSSNTNPATNITRTSAILNGQINPKGATSNYWFEYGVTSNFGNITSFEAGGNGTAAVSVSAPLTGLNPLTKYFYRLNVQNQFGTVNGATQTFTTSGPATPGVPTVQTTPAKNIASTTVTMTGRVTPNGANTTYWFEYSNESLLGSILGTATRSQVLSAGENTTEVSFNEDGLTPETKYYYRLMARNQYGTIEGEVMTFTTKRN